LRKNNDVTQPELEDDLAMQAERETVGKRIRRLREQRGLSQRELAEPGERGNVLIAEATAKEIGRVSLGVATEETIRPRRLEKSRRDCLEAYWLASFPAGLCPP